MRLLGRSCMWYAPSLSCQMGLAAPWSLAGSSYVLVWWVRWSVGGVPSNDGSGLVHCGFVVGSVRNFART